MASKTQNDGAMMRSTDLDAPLILTGEQGRTLIQDEVVAKIAGLAIREVEGVHALVPYGTGQTISAAMASISGNERKDMGVRVEVGQVEAAVDVRIITAYGVSIPALADAIRKNVEARIHTMTGLKVKEINIEVVDLYFAEREQLNTLSPRVQ